MSAAALTGAAWTAAGTTAGMAGVSCTYAVVTAKTGPLTKVTMTVPPGTGGTPR